MLSFTLLAITMSYVSARFNSGMFGQNGFQELGGSIFSGYGMNLNHGFNDLTKLNCHSNGIGGSILDGLTEYADGRQGTIISGLFGNLGHNFGNSLGLLQGGYGGNDGYHRASLRSFGGIGNSLGGIGLQSHFGDFNSYGFGNGQGLSNFGYKGVTNRLSQKGGMDSHKNGGNGIFGYGNENNFGIFSGGNQKGGFKGLQRGNSGGYGKSGKGGKSLKGSGILSQFGGIENNFGQGLGFQGLTGNSILRNRGY